MPNSRPDVTVCWHVAQQGDIGLRSKRALYAMQHRRTREILYLGKAGNCSVGERLRCRSKNQVWEYLAEVGVNECRVLLGEVTFAPGSRYSNDKLSDLEGLLIAAVDPPANISGTRSRVTRPCWRVACRGSWPGGAVTYVDGGF